MPPIVELITKWQKKWFGTPKPTKLDRLGIFVSYPKSGRTWLRVIFDELGIVLKYSHDGMGLGKSRSFNRFDHCRRKSYSTEPVIFMARDPRDTAVSSYFYTSLRHGSYNRSISSFIRDPLHGVEKIILYNLTWLECGPRFPAFLPITYEEMNEVPFGVVRKTTDFLGANIADSELERAIANNTFEKMHEREATGAYLQSYGGTFSSGHDTEPEMFKVRRGKIGGYSDYLTVGDVAYCDEILSRYGYFDRLDQLLSLTNRGQQKLTASSK